GAAGERHLIDRPMRYDRNLAECARSLGEREQQTCKKGIEVFFHEACAAACPMLFRANFSPPLHPHRAIVSPQQWFPPCPASSSPASCRMKSKGGSPNPMTRASTPMTTVWRKTRSLLPQRIATRS